MSNDSTAQKLQELFDLFQSEAITKEEFDSLKSELLGLGSNLDTSENTGIRNLKDNEIKSNFNAPSPDSNDEIGNALTKNRELLNQINGLCQSSSSLYKIRETFSLIDFEILKKNHQSVDEQIVIQIVEYIVTCSLIELKRKSSYIINDLVGSYLHLDYFTKDSDSKIAHIWYTIGNKQVEFKSYAEALNSFQKAIDLMPDESKYRENYSELSKINSKKRNRKALILISSFVFVIALIYFLNSIHNKNILVAKEKLKIEKERSIADIEDDEFWIRMKSTSEKKSTSEFVEMYLQNYWEHGRHVSEAEDLIWAFLKKESPYVSKRYFNVDGSLKFTYKEYLAYFPNGKYASIVKDSIRIFNQREKERQLNLLKSQESEINNTKAIIEVMDIDSNVYKTVRIGLQMWMAENLKVTRFNDGTAIPMVKDINLWRDQHTSAYCWYDNSAINGKTYGALYNWFTVENRKLCPIGWHVPSDEEWTTLTIFLDGEDVAGGKLKENTSNYWKSPNKGSTNETSFTALPSGNRSTNRESFSNLGEIGSWWSSSGVSSTRNINSNSGGIFIGGNINKYSGLSVRCIKDN